MSRLSFQKILAEKVDEVKYVDILSRKLCTKIGKRVSDFGGI